jgi:hypothetical protein
LGHLDGIRYYHVPELLYSESQSGPEVGNTRHFENGIEAGRISTNVELLELERAEEAVEGCARMHAPDIKTDARIRASGLKTR